MTGDLLGALKGREITESSVSPEQLGELVAFIAKGEISGKMAKDIFAKMFETGESAAAIIDREGLRQISDTDALEKIVDEVIAASPEASGAVQIREDRRDRLSGGAGDEGEQGAGESGGGE